MLLKVFTKANYTFACLQSNEVFPLLNLYFAAQKSQWILFVIKHV